MRTTAPVAAKYFSPVSLIVQLLLGCLFTNTALHAALSNAAHTNEQLTQVSIATSLTEVQRGTVDGRNFLTLHIAGDAVGPSSCRSNILRMDASGEAATQHQNDIEAIALTAILAADTVVIVVPLSTNECVDGKPTFTDLYLLPPKP